MHLTWPWSQAETHNPISFRSRRQPAHDCCARFDNALLSFWLEDCSRACWRNRNRHWNPARHILSFRQTENATRKGHEASPWGYLKLKHIVGIVSAGKESPPISHSSEIPIICIWSKIWEDVPAREGEEGESNRTSKGKSSYKIYLFRLFWIIVSWTLAIVIFSRFVSVALV